MQFVQFQLAQTPTVVKEVGDDPIRRKVRGSWRFELDCY